MTRRDAILFLAFAALCVGCAVLLPATPRAGACQAYLDPSTGAMIISAIVGVAATIALGVKTFWYKLRAPFRKKKSADGK
jgi:multisubunit Na+/H+ antiporter MnhC subunit